VSASRSFDELVVGSTFGSATYEVTADEIVAFARQYDPQPFHLDPEAARASAFGRLVASGWHTAAITMRLFITSEFEPPDGWAGAGVDDLRWTRPVVPGDVLHLRITLSDLRVSRSKPDRGLVTFRIETRNAADEIVQTLVLKSVVPRGGPSQA
jgi:acyl dehydratase